MANMFDWTITQGDSFTEEITVEADGTPLDITGAHFTFTAKKNPVKDADVDALIGPHSWSAHTDAVNGVTTLQLTPDETTIPPNPAGWPADLQFEPQAGSVLTLHGVVRIIPQVTQARAL